MIFYITSYITYNLIVRIPFKETGCSQSFVATTKANKFKYSLKLNKNDSKTFPYIKFKKSQNPFGSWRVLYKNKQESLKKTGFPSVNAPLRLGNKI